jgi:heme/copper-type cytochrome/quinol oxidase subunit 2
MSVRLVDALFWAGVGLSAVAQVAILRSVIRTTFRKRPADGAEPGTPPPTRTSALVELTWAILPAFALVAVFIATRWAIIGASI